MWKKKKFLNYKFKSVILINPHKKPKVSEMLWKKKEITPIKKSIRHA